VSKKKET